MAPVDAKRRSMTAGGDGPQKKDDKSKDKKPGKEKDTKQKGKEKDENEGRVKFQLTPSAMALEDAMRRAEQRRHRFKRKWPKVTKVKITTNPWYPPGPPQRPPKVTIELPPLETRRWVPPFKRRRRARPKLMRIPPDQIQQPMYECSMLKKVWHNFKQVDSNKMMLQGSWGCNSKRYSSTHCGSQTGCIAIIARALLEEKDTADLTRRDVDDAIEYGDRFYKQCMIALKCYKGKPALQLCQLLPSFYFHDTKYTIKLNEIEKGVLAKHPENTQAEQDLMAMMNKRAGSKYMFIITVDETRHFLVWGNPPESGGNVKTVCYIFEPYMLDEFGTRNDMYGAGAVLRYPGVTSFVLDFVSHHGDLVTARRRNPTPLITLTVCDIVQKEPLLRAPLYEIDLKALKIHCSAEWHVLHTNSLLDKKIHQGQYPLASLSGISLATSRASFRRRVRDFYQKNPKEPSAVPPVAAERGPACPTVDNLMNRRGEDFFLYCPRPDGHLFGRDDLIPYPKSEMALHSPVEVADKNYHSQYQRLDPESYILRSRTRHMAVRKYYIPFKTYCGVACCVVALGMLRRLKARAWNEDTLDETMDTGFNYYRESLAKRGGPIRRLVLGELNEIFSIRGDDYKQKLRGIAVWGKLMTKNPKIFDICRGIEAFFKESDGGVLQVPGEYETAIWNEGGKYYLYHPWPADASGRKVSLQGGGKACIMYFTSIERLCEHFMICCNAMKRKPFSISDIAVYEIAPRPEPVNLLKPVAPNRWVMRGDYNFADARFSPDNRGKQATPIAMTALGLAHVIDPNTWTPEDVNEILNRGDALYEKTLEHLEKLGINYEQPGEEKIVETEESEESPVVGGTSQGPTSTLAAADVVPRFRVSDFDCIEMDVLEDVFLGQLNAEPGSGVLSLRDSLNKMFEHSDYAVLTARGTSLAVWKQDEHYYMFDPQGCDENGLPSDDLRASAATIRMKPNIRDLTAMIIGNLEPGTDDSFQLSPVEVTATKLNTQINAPETKLDSKAFQWINRGTCAIMMGPRGENSALGKAFTRSNAPKDDLAGRTLALPAAAAFTAAADVIPPPHMHMDHMYNFLEAGAEYYLQHVKATNRLDIKPEDLTQKFELGVNTFSIELGEPTRLTLHIPSEAGGEGEEGGDEKELGEGEEAPESMKQIKDLLTKMWNDTTKPTTTSLLVGDYHTMGIWMVPGGKVVAFDPAPTLYKGLLTPQRIKKGDQLREQRIKDEMGGEGEEEDDEDEEDDEGEAAEGEEKIEEPDVVPPESCPVIYVAASPGELMDKLILKGMLTRKQTSGPYWLYPVKVTNELTTVLKDRRSVVESRGGGGETAEEEGAAEAEEVLVEPLEDSYVGKYYTRIGRAVASVRGRVAQNENYFLDEPNRDRQDAATCIMAITADNIEPCITWKPVVLDAIIKYGDRLYTMSLPNAAEPPFLVVTEVAKEFKVNVFEVRVDVEPSAVIGDLKAGENSDVLSPRRGVKQFLDQNKYGVICAKDFCAAIWKVADNCYAYFDPHPTGPGGKTYPGGSAALVVFSNSDDLADTFKANVENLARPFPNRFTIASVKIDWNIAKLAPIETMAAVPDETYEHKVLTAFVETSRGRTILRGTRPCDLAKFVREAVLQSAAAAIVAACMSDVRKSHLWTRKTIDEIMSIGGALFNASTNSLGYEFRPGEDILLPLQVLKRFLLGVNFIRYDLQSVYSGKLESIKPNSMNVRTAVERFFELYTHGILWCQPHAVAIWKVSGAPSYYMMEPHACGPTGMRIDAMDDGAACAMSFTSAKLMAFSYLQNYNADDRRKKDFILYSMAINVHPLKKLKKDPPLLRAHLAATMVPATSKVDIEGRRRRANENDRAHPPGSATCLDAQRASEARDKEDKKFKGQRNSSGWLVLADGTQYLSAQHSMSCKKFPQASRGNQALAMCVMAVAMSRVEDVCRWCSTTLDSVMESGDQLYQDSYLHFRPKDTKILGVEQILRKFYTPGNCVCRVVVYQPRQKGIVGEDLYDQLMQFFREEKAGVFVARDGEFAVALFRTPRGLYMFDPGDRDRYGRAVAPPCTGKARACFSQYPTVATLAEKLAANIPPTLIPMSTVRFEQGKENMKELPPTFTIYGMDVTSLRRLNQHEK